MILTRRKRRYMQQRNEKNGKEILGFCHYCKGEVYKDADDTLIRRHKPYHQFCWEQQYNRPKELKFE